MFKKTAFVIIIAAFLVGGCASKIAPTPPQFNEGGVVAPMDAAAEARSPGAVAPASTAAPAPAQSGGGKLPALPGEVKRLVIQNVDMSIVVEDPALSMDTIATMANDMGGFVVTSKIFKAKTRDGIEIPEANITIRVPAAKLDTALDKIRALTPDAKKYVLTENRTGQDVTKEYTDSQSRLANLEQAEKQLREVMASAIKTEDILDVYRELTNVREQIEVLKGQLKYYEEASALSAIVIRIQAQEAFKPITVAGWEPTGVARDAAQALVDALKFLVNAGIWIIIFIIPVMLVILAPIFLIILLIRRLVRRRKAAAKAKQAAAAGSAPSSPAAPPAPPEKK